MSIADLISNDTETTPVAPSNDALQQIAELAEQQLSILGKGSAGFLKQGPSGSMISDLLSWGKKNGVQLPTYITDVRAASIAELVAALIDKYAEYRSLSEVRIPLALAAVGMKAFSLADGTGIKVEDDIAVGLVGELAQPALDFLTSINCADVVKDEIKISLGKGETDKAHLIMALANQLGVAAAEKMSIHAATLKALVKEQREKGVEFPAEYFSIFPFQKTIIQPKK
jgi:hypothetical protein